MKYSENSSSRTEKRVLFLVGEKLIMAGANTYEQFHGSVHVFSLEKQWTPTATFLLPLLCKCSYRISCFVFL